MRFTFLLLFCSIFHCNIDGYLKVDLKSPKTTKSKKARKSINFYDNTKVGTVLDQLDGVGVYFNGPITNVIGRNVTPDGYNLGLKYQCVEFVKRYYYERYNHKMPDSYGHAKDFYDVTLKGHGYNRKRGLFQHPNGGAMIPKHGDLVIFGASRMNPFGHVAIVSKVTEKRVELIQQNVAKSTRASYKLQSYNAYFNIDDPDIIGWLSKHN